MGSGILRLALTPHLRLEDFAETRKFRDDFQTCASVLRCLIRGIQTEIIHLQGKE